MLNGEHLIVLVWFFFLAKFEILGTRTKVHRLASYFKWNFKAKWVGEILRVSEMAPWVQVLTANPDDMHATPGTHKMEGEN